MKPKLLANGLIFSNGFRSVGSIVIENGVIRSVDCGRTVLADIDSDEYEVFDCEGKMVLPGVIDEHVHFRDPGLTVKGDMATESRAAVAGGVTSFFDMPNTLPQTTTIEAWNEKMEIGALSSAANYAFFMGATESNLDEIMNADATRIPGVKLFLGSSTGGMLVEGDSAIRNLFRNYRGVIACHAESESVIRSNRERLSALYPEGIPVGLHNEVRSRRACIEATSRAVALARETDARLHVMHISTADELQFFTAGDIAFKRITAETCPHYLIFNDSSVEKTGGLTKCNPAIKTETDRCELLKAVADGRINVVATDHAPHLLAQKQGDALTAASGMPSIQFSLPLMLQLAYDGYFSFEDVVERMCSAPAQLYGIDRRGMIAPHYWADLVVVDPDADYEITNSSVLSRCGWTPFEGMRLKFGVKQTWVNGELAYADGEFTGMQTPLAIRFNR